MPNWINQTSFNKAHDFARKAAVDGNDTKDEALMRDFRRVIIDSLKKKCGSGLDVINYPQHYDMHKQFTDSIHEAMNKGTYMVDQERALIPEVHVIKSEAKRICEEIDNKLRLRVCITGPLELYLKEVGSIAHEDVLLMFAETVRRFARNAILNTKYVKTQVVSLDEPSFGFLEIHSDRDVILNVLEKAFDFDCSTKQIHLHSSSRVSDLLNVENLDVLSLESASSTRNIESISKGMLEAADKEIRVGISRTDVDTIMAELRDKGMIGVKPERLVESAKTMRKRFLTAKRRYGDRMSFTGPDCGLGGWPTQEAAQLLLKRTVLAAKTYSAS